MPLGITQVDAFTNRPFAGNPAAVCILDSPRDDAWMRDVAREMNLSETAFLHPENGGYRLRWFTPQAEVALCGHATLASAHVLWEQRHLDPSTVARFHTKSGLLTATRRGDWIELDFPATKPERTTAPAGLIEALRVEPLGVWRSRFDYLIELADEAAVRKTSPDLGVLMDVEARGVMITSRAADREFDFVSRFFAPSVGVNEDPVTGSAHCALGPFWAERLGRTELVAFQASARGGVVRVHVKGDRVLLGGQAVTVLRGELL